MIYISLYQLLHRNLQWKIETCQLKNALENVELLKPLARITGAFSCTGDRRAGESQVQRSSQHLAMLLANFQQPIAAAKLEKPH